MHGLKIFDERWTALIGPNRHHEVRHPIVGRKELRSDPTDCGSDLRFVGGLMIFTYLDEELLFFATPACQCYMCIVTATGSVQQDVVDIGHPTQAVMKLKPVARDGEEIEKSQYPGGNLHNDKVNCSGLNMNFQM